MRPVTSPVQFHTPQTPRTTPTFSGYDTFAPRVTRAPEGGSHVSSLPSLCRDEVPNELSSRLHHLEVMLQQLNTDLERVRLFLSFQEMAVRVLNVPTPTLALLCLWPPRRSRIKWSCWRRWPT